MIEQLVKLGVWPNMQQIRTNTVAAVAAAICIAGAFPVAAHAQSCPANSNALGTSRILVVAPTDYMRAWHDAVSGDPPAR